MSEEKKKEEVENKDTTNKNTDWFSKDSTWRDRGQIKKDCCRIWQL